MSFQGRVSGPGLKHYAVLFVEQAFNILLEKEINARALWAARLLICLPEVGLLSEGRCGVGGGGVCVLVKRFPKLELLCCCSLRKRLDGGSWSSAGGWAVCGWFGWEGVAADYLAIMMVGFLVTNYFPPLT